MNKTYPGGVRAVCDLDIQIPDGEFVVLAGPSGCGKTTTLRLIAGLERPTSGEIQLGGQNVGRMPAAKRNIAMVFQAGALYPSMSVRKNLAFGLSARHASPADIELRIAEVAKRLGIETLLSRRPAQLSGGERQRVAIGRAMVRQPALFLFDEPLSNLDTPLRAALRTEIAAMHQRLGTTTLYVTHDQTEAMTLADRLVVMSEGRVQQIGTPSEIYQKPANRFVATFIGNPVMNLLEGVFENGTFRAGNATWQVAGAADGPIVLGVRPEDLLIASADDPVLVTATCHRTEYLGHELLAYLNRGDHSFTMRLAGGQTVSTTEPVPLTIRPDSYHLFAFDEAGTAAFV